MHKDHAAGKQGSRALRFPRLFTVSASFSNGKLSAPCDSQKTPCTPNSRRENENNPQRNDHAAGKQGSRALLFPRFFTIFARRAVAKMTRQPTRIFLRTKCKT